MFKIGAIVSLALIKNTMSQSTQCPSDPNFPDCMPKPVTGDQFASFRVPLLAGVPGWTELVASITDNSSYSWYTQPVLVPPADGGAMPGGPNGKGVAWQAPGNLASEVFDCPDNTVALTFDDGPVYCDQTLEILKRNNAVATFFLVGSTILATPGGKAQVKSIYDAGHQIALHSYTHRPITQETSDVFIAEVVFNILTIYNIIGKVPRYFRPPYAAIDDRTRFILASMGLRPALWNIESLDANIGLMNVTDRTNTTVESVLNHVYAGFARKYDPKFGYFPGIGTNPTRYNGFVTLEHDISADDLKVAETLVPWIIKEGYKLAYVNACDRQTPNAGFYLEDSHPLTLFIKSIKLPLTAADYDGTAPVFKAPAGSTGSGATGNFSTGGNGTGGSSAPKPNSSSKIGFNYLKIFFAAIVLALFN